MKRNPIFVGLAVAGALALVGCSQSSPTAPKQPTPTAYAIALSANPNVAGINESILLVALLSGTVPDGTSVTFTTTIGVFENGKQEETRTTTGGRATATLVSLSGGDGLVTARVPNKSDSIAVHFRGGSAAQLAINSVQPNRGKPAGGDQVVIHGQGFIAPLDVNFIVAGVPYPAIIVSVAADGSSITVLTPQISGSSSIDRLADVQVKLRGVVDTSGNPVSTTFVGGFTFSADTGIPLLYNVAPSTGSAAGGEIITLTGKFFTEPFEVDFNFTDPSGVLKSLPGRTVDVQHGADGTDIAHIVVPRASTTTVTQPIFVDLVLKNALGGASPQSSTYPRAFVYVPDVTAPPTIFYISPTFGSVQGHETVMIYGKNFVQPVTVLIGAVNEIVQSVSSDGTTITIMTQPVPGAVPTTAQDVTVTTSLGVATLSAAFTYLEGQAPTLYVLTPNNGPNEGGTRVTITGVGFQYPVQVLFGTQQAQVVSTNYNQVVCTSPSITASQPGTPTTVQVSVTNMASGKVSQNTLPFQYGQAMFISSLAPNRGPDIGGTQVTIVGQGFVAPVTVTLAGWSAQVQSVSGTQIVVLSGAVPTASRQCVPFAGPVVVTNTDSGLQATGPSWTYLPVSKPTIISVTASCEALGVIPGSATNCTYTVVGTNFESPLVATFSNPATSYPIAPASVTPTQLTFTVPPSFESLGIQYNKVPCAIGAQTGTMNVTTPINLTITNAATTCSDTLTNVILVDPTDKACKLGGALSVNCTAAPSSGAAPLTVQFTSTPIGGTGAYTYDWNFGDGTTPDDKTQNPTHTYAGTGTFTATVTVNDGTSVATCTQTITVN